MGCAASVTVLVTLAAASNGTLLDLIRPVGLGSAFSAQERVQVDSGRVVAKVVETGDRSEIAAVSAVRLGATRGRFLECVRDPECLRGSDDLIEAGLLRPSPSPSDLRALTLQPRDVGYLRQCRVGRCQVRLSAELIERFRHDVDWTSPAHSQEAAAVLRQALARYASQYLRAGDAALMRYEDDPDPVSIAESTRLLLGRLADPFSAAPGLLGYLEGFPRPRPAGTEDFLYWYQERFWRKTVVALNHVVIADLDAPPPAPVFVVTKQLYASHYFESSFELLVFEDAPVGDPGRLVYLSRSRADIRPSGFNALERLLIRRLVRGRLERQLGRLRETLEGRGAPSSGPRVVADPSRAGHGGGAGGTRGGAGPGNPSETSRP